MVNRYWAVKVAVKVVAPEGALMVWLWAPPSLQLAKTLRVPPVPWGEVVATVCWLPVVH